MTDKNIRWFLYRGIIYRYRLCNVFKPSFGEQGKQGDPAEEYSVIHSFPLFWKHYIFVQEGRARKKEEKDYVTVRVAVAK